MYNVAKPSKRCTYTREEVLVGTAQTMLPAFNSGGNLPEGIHLITEDESSDDSPRPLLAEDR